MREVGVMGVKEVGGDVREGVGGCISSRESRAFGGGST